MIDFEAAVRQSAPRIASPQGPKPANRAVNDTGMVPAPGQGRTAFRHRILCELGRADLGMARLGEAQLDALAILFEAGREPLEGVLYGVWAATRGLKAEPADGYWRVSGKKTRCTGGAFVSAALVAADSPDGVLLFEVQMSTRGIHIQRPTDHAPSGEAETLSDGMDCTVAFEGVMVSEASVIDSPDWYRTRPGFWHGAIGPAACWAGGAQSLVDAVQKLNPTDPSARAQLAALEAISWNLTSILDLAGREIDADPGDFCAARSRALRVRHLVRCNCMEVLERFSSASSPDLLAFDEEVARQHAALSSCMRHHRGDFEAVSGAMSALS